MPVILALALACSVGTPVPVGDGGAYVVDRVPSDDRALDGISGLAADPAGALWAAPERGARLVRLSLDPPAFGAALPIEGLPDGHDVESLAFVRDGRAVVGLEGKRGAHGADPVAWLVRDGDHLRVGEVHPLDWGLWDLEAPDNAGVEALCADGEDIWAAGEAVLQDSGRRFAPLARFDADTSTWVPHRLALTSDEGKIAALTCHGGRAWVIERHFGIQRVLTFPLPLAPGVVVTPTLLAEPGVDANLEGIERLADGTLLLVSDNSYGGRDGDTVLVRFTPRD